jgi:general secretion pathway protein N
VKKALKYILLGVVMYVIFMVANLPAPWRFSPGLQSRLGGWMLYGVQGTLWQGRAAVVKSRNLQVENLHWDLQPASLLWGRLETALRFKYAGEPATLTLGRSITGTWHVDDVDMELPAARLTPLLRLPGAELGGRLAVKLASLTVKKGRVTAATGNVTWDKAALRRPVAVELGAFTVKLKTGADGVEGTLLDHGGAVQAQGVVKLSANGRYQFTATFASRDPRQPLISQGLRLFGNPGADGRVKYSASGVVPAILPGG